ncbi:MAG: hypothetical protein Q9227_009133 [Pyrenula ochraceoflavens]
MAEVVGVLGLVASLINISDAGFKISKSLYNLGGSLFKAKTQIEELARELSNISSAFGSLAEVLEASVGLLKPSLLDTAHGILQDCQETYTEIDENVKTVSRKAMRARDRAQWIFRKAKVKQLRARLDSSKATLHLMVSILDLSAGLKSIRRQGEDPHAASINPIGNAQQKIRASSDAVLKAQSAVIEAEKCEKELLRSDGRSHRQALKLHSTSRKNPSTALVRSRPMQDFLSELPDMDGLSLTKSSGISREESDQDSSKTAYADAQSEALTLSAGAAVRYLCNEWTYIDEVDDVETEPQAGSKTDTCDAQEDHPREIREPSLQGSSTYSPQPHSSSNFNLREFHNHVWLAPCRSTPSDSYSGAVRLDFIGLRTSSTVSWAWSQVAPILPKVQRDEEVLLFALDGNQMVQLPPCGWDISRIICLSSVMELWVVNRNRDNSRNVIASRTASYWPQTLSAAKRQGCTELYDTAWDGPSPLTASMKSFHGGIGAGLKARSWQVDGLDWISQQPVIPLIGDTVRFTDDRNSSCKSFWNVPYFSTATDSRKEVKTDAWYLPQFQKSSRQTPSTSRKQKPPIPIYSEESEGSKDSESVYIGFRGGTYLYRAPKTSSRYQSGYQNPTKGKFRRRHKEGKPTPSQKYDIVSESDSEDDTAQPPSFRYALYTPAAKMTSTEDDPSQKWVPYKPAAKMTSTEDELEGFDSSSFSSSSEDSEVLRIPVRRSQTTPLPKTRKTPLHNFQTTLPYTSQTTPWRNFQTAPPYTSQTNPHYNYQPTPPYTSQATPLHNFQPPLPPGFQPFPPEAFEAWKSVGDQSALDFMEHWNNMVEMTSNARGSPRNREQ